MNLPNKITISRIIMIFIFLILANVEPGKFFSENFTRGCHISAYVIAILAGITDLLDGWIARKYNMVTDFGALMDPLADKIFIVTAFLMCVEYGLMPAWIAVVVITREFLVTGLRTLAVQHNHIISADRWGKLKTLSQMLMLLIAGASWNRIISLKEDVIFGIQAWTLWNIFLWGIIVITVFSGAKYFYVNRGLYSKSM